MLTLLICIFVALLVLGVPIAFSMAIAAGAFFVVGDYGLTTLAQRIVCGLNSFSTLAIPFFMLSGYIMGKGGVSKRILNFANACIGYIKGGMAMTGVVACTLFGAICGSAPATAVAVGSILGPDMVQRGYKKSFVGLIFGVAGCLGLLIPPSLIMVILGSTVGISIGDMFMGGVGPGVLMALMLCVYCYWQSKKHGYGTAHAAKGQEQLSFSWKELGKAAIGALLPMTTPVFVLGSITAGIATATEAAVISVVWALFLSMVVYREIKPRDLLEVFTVGAVSSAGVTGVIAAASTFSWALAIMNVPTKLSDFFNVNVSSVAMFMLFTFVLVFLLGCVTESVCIITIFAPILYPIALSMGIDGLQYSIFLTMVLTIGAVTPPVGLSLISACRVVDSKIEDTFPEILHCIAIMVIVTVLIGVFPALSTWLPNALK